MTEFARCCEEPGAPPTQAEPTATCSPAVEVVARAVESLNPAGLGHELPAPASDLAASGLLEMRVGDLARLHAQTDLQVAQVQASLDALAKQVSFLPPQLRMFGAKIDGLAISISESRCRALLAAIAAILGLVEDMLRAMADQTAVPCDHYGNYEVLRTQLRQLLDANGLLEIAVEGPFDPRFHRAVQRVVSDDPADHNRILSVVRPGFRTPQAVLRYAEVKVGYCASFEGGGQITDEEQLEKGDKR